MSLWEVGLAGVGGNQPGWRTEVKQTEGVAEQSCWQEERVGLASEKWLSKDSTTKRFLAKEWKRHCGILAKGTKTVKGKLL